jgi:hypothetical protein
MRIQPRILPEKSHKMIYILKRLLGCMENELLWGTETIRSVS